MLPLFETPFPSFGPSVVNRRGLYAAVLNAVLTGTLLSPVWYFSRAHEHEKDTPVCAALCTVCDCASSSCIGCRRGGGGYQEHSPLPDSQIYPGTGAYGIRLVRDRGELARAGVLEIDKFNAVQIQRIGAGSRLLATFLMRDCFNAKQKSIFMRT